MPKFFVKENQINNDKINIIGEDVKHISKVLRLKEEDCINVCNSDSGENYNCKILKIEEDRINCSIINIDKSNSESLIGIHIYQALPKADKMELIIQKSTELGAKKIIPVNMERCVVKLTSKDTLKKIERWQKIAEVASKQSGRDIIPKIGQLISINQVKEEINKYDLFLVAYENEKENTLKEELKKVKTKNAKIAVLIGPEGGISEKEINLLKENGAKVITLGNRILRTETVALAMTSIIMYELS